MMQKLMENPDLSQNQELRDLIDQIIERMEEEGLDHSATVRARHASTLRNSGRTDWAGPAERGGPI